VSNLYLQQVIIAPNIRRKTIQNPTHGVCVEESNFCAEDCFCHSIMQDPGRTDGDAKANKCSSDSQNNHQTAQTSYQTENIRVILVDCISLCPSSDSRYSKQNRSLSCYKQPKDRNSISNTTHCFERMCKFSLLNNE
jgi:hypothetical protein